MYYSKIWHLGHIGQFDKYAEVYIVKINTYSSMYYLQMCGTYYKALKSTMISCLQQYTHQNFPWLDIFALYEFIFRAKRDYH